MNVPPTGTTSPLAGVRHLAVRRMLLPVAVLAAVVVPSFRVLTTAGELETWNYSLCQTTILRDDAPPSDVLIMGSSRTGAAIDAVRVAESFTGSLDTAEKAVYALGSEFDRDLAFRTYLQHRGVPKVLVVEASFERYADRIVDQGSMYVPTGRAATLFGADVFADLTADMRDSGSVSLSDTYLESNWRSTPWFWIERLNQGFDLAVHNPRIALNPREECTWKYQPRSGRWVVGNSEPYVEGSVGNPPRRKIDRWSSRSERFLPLDLGDDWTKQELALLNDLVREAYDAGVESVVLMYLPSFGERPDVIDLDAVRAAVPETEIFDGRDVLLDPTRPNLRYQYFDVNHMNRFAAHEISVSLAALVEDVIR